MTSINALKRHPPPFKKTESLHRFVAVFRTGRSKTTGAVWKKDLHEPMIWRERFLIDTNKHQNNLSRKAGDLVREHTLL